MSHTREEPVGAHPPRRDDAPPPEGHPHAEPHQAPQAVPGANPAELPPEGIEASTVDFRAERDSAEFSELRSKFRSFAFPMTVAFMVWYLGYVLASTFAVGFMSTPVIGNLNVGLLWGLAQFATTFLLTYLYVRHANKNLDPLTRAMRQRFAQTEGKI